MPPIRIRPWEEVRQECAALLMAAEWLDAGCRRHEVAAPAGDEALLDAWFRLAFGRQLTLGRARAAGRTTACAQ